ncbi:MAG: response regulator [Leptolyngbyaceae cyanobacterium SM2_5_2]|nr:response regulator [Leptolyngbyaceae cyanobacterium SM2_5_2]
MESLGILTSGIAHNLNNVFTPIYGVAQLLTQPNSKLDAESRAMMKLLTKSTERGIGMVKQILAFTRGADQQTSLVDMAALVKEVVSVIQQIFPQSIRIRQHIPAQAAWLVLADFNYLNQVLMNLCINARDAMPDGGVLSLSIETFFVDEDFANANLGAEVGDYVVVTIADTGTGISPDVIDHIFDPFFTTKEPDKGTGLGLSTVLGIVKNYGGFLQVFSEVGQGTQFKVYLPQAQGEEISCGLPEEPIYGDWETILLVDDEVNVQLSIHALLESYNYVVLSTNSSLAALETYAQYQDDIGAVILDIGMPTLDGFGLIQRLREINPAVKIMAISGLPSNQEKALAAGAMVFLAKPFSLNELLRELYGLVYGHGLEV